MLKQITILIIVLLLVTIVGYSQNVPVKEFTKPFKIGGGENELMLNDRVPMLTLHKSQTVSGTRVGYTYYDYMTNGAVGERLLNFGDGTFMVGTMGAIDAPVRTRGTYYNYFDGTSWLDTVTYWKRIETVRRGWGTIGAFSTLKAGVIASHTGINVAVNAGTATEPGWINLVVPPSLLWPKIAVDDAGTGEYLGIYITAGFDSPSPQKFWLSLDAGDTWAIKDLADTSSARFKEGYTVPGADDYMVAAKNGKIAVGSLVTYGDITLYLSTDNGTTFSTTTIYDMMVIDTALSSIPFDTTFFPAQTYKMLGIEYPDGTGDVHIDKDGNVHIAWGTRELGYRIPLDTLGQPIRDTLTGNLTRKFFVTDWASTGIKYWRTGMTNPVTAVLPTASMMHNSLRTFDETTGVPYNINSGLDMSLIGIPSLGSDANGNVYMIFQGFKGDDIATLPGDAGPSPFGHIYAIGTTDGINWTTPIDIYGAAITGEDVLYASLADLVDNKLHILVQNDGSPGTWLQQINHPQNLNYFIYTTVDKSAIVGVGDDNPMVNSFKLEQNYPNPFNPTTRIEYSLSKDVMVSLKVYNILGQEVAALVNQKQTPGEYVVNFDASKLSSGVYIYTLKAGTFTTSKKMLLMK